MESVDIEELEGVDTERSRRGVASRAREGETLEHGELGLSSGEVALLKGGVAVVSVSAMFVTRDPAGLVGPLFKLLNKIAGKGSRLTFVALSNK